MQVRTKMILCAFTAIVISGVAGPVSRLSGSEHHAKYPVEPYPPLSGRRVSEDDQRQVQAAHPLGPAGWAAALWRAEKEPAARRRGKPADRPARSQPRAQGAG